MAILLKHAKTNAIADWVQADLDAAIVAGDFAPGTVLADIALPSDWNANHTLTATANSVLSTQGTTTVAEVTLSASQLVGRGSTGDVAAITLGSNLSFSGTTLNTTGVLLTSAIGSTVQGYDADLASWAGVTRASGFDTFAATPSSANLRSLLTDETGSGGAAVFATSPAITTPTLTDPIITGTILEDIFTITDGAAFEIDPGNGSIQLITLTASRTPKATNFAAGESITLMVADGTAYTLTWTDATWGGSGVVWVGGSAPTLATTGYTVIALWKVGSATYGKHVGDVA